MSNPAAKHASPRGPFAAAVMCAGAGLILFQFFGNATRGYVHTTSLFWWWISQWLDPNAETEHGWLVLALSAWLLWKNLSMADRGVRRADWDHHASDDSSATDRSIHAQPDNPRSAIGDPPSITPALGALFAGLALHALGFVAQQSRISIVALLVFTWGVLRLGGGRRWGAAALFPLGFMLFAIPVSMLDEIGLPLRLWVTAAGERIAHATGIGVLRSGTQLIAPDGRFHYDVAAPCSGVRSLVALTALSVLVAYLNFRTWRRRAVVVALCFPLVYLGNVVRIVAIIFAAQWGGPNMGETVHTVMGYGVFALVLGGLLGAVGEIHRRWPEDKSERGFPSLDTHDGFIPVGGRAARPYFGATAVILLATLEAMFLQRLADLPPRGDVGVVLTADGRDPVDLPAFIGTDWIGRRTEISAVERDVLPPDTGFSRRHYVAIADARKAVFLSIVLSGRDRTSIHRPELCLVGQGWTILHRAEHAFRFPGAVEGDARLIPATVLRVNRELPTPQGKRITPELVAYWFVAGDTIVASHWQRFLHDAWNRVVHARADRWAYVLVQTDATDGEVAALARMQTVLNETLPVFQRRERRTP